MPRWLIYPFGPLRYTPDHDHALRSDGYRPVAMSIYGGTLSPRYAAIFVQGQDYSWRNWLHCANASLEEVEDFYHTHKYDYEPRLISATGPSKPPYWDVCFSLVMVERTRDLADEWVWLKLTDKSIKKKGSFQYWNARAHFEGFMLRSATMYQDPVHFAGIWVRNTNRIVWDYSYGDSASEYQRIFGEYSSSHVRTGALSISDSRRYLSVWRDDWATDNWFAKHHLTKQSLDAVVGDVLQKGTHWPIHLAAGGESEPDARFAAVFLPYPMAGSGPRKWTVTGRPDYSRTPDSALQPSFQRFDNAMQDMMQSQGIRSASLAIGRNGRLSYAKAFTWAEGGHPIADPTTLFRLGSVSKSITAVALFNLLERISGPANINAWLDRPLLDIVPLSTFRGDPPGRVPGLPPFPNQELAWREITLRDLLWHGAGINNNVDWGWHPQVLQNLKHALGIFGPGTELLAGDDLPDYPLAMEWYAQNLASSPRGINRWPGTTHQYGFGFFFLHLAIDQLVRLFFPQYAETFYVGNFEDGNYRVYSRAYERWVQKQVWLPLGVTRAAVGASFPNDRVHEPNIEYPPQAEARRARGVPFPAHPGAEDILDGSWKIPPRWMLATSAHENRLASLVNGGYNYRVHASHGGWVASTVDLVRLLVSFDLTNSPILSPTARAILLSSSQPLADIDAKGSFNDVGPTILHGFYDFGRDGANALVDAGNTPRRAMWHNGRLAGGEAFVFRRLDGLSAAIAVDRDGSRSNDILIGAGNMINQMANAIAPRLWPGWDLFPAFGIPTFFPGPLFTGNPFDPAPGP